MELKFDTPSEAIFIAKYGKGHKSLFESQIDLSTEIMNYPGSEFKNKNALTVRSTISQLFTGERNLSKNLRTILFLVIEKRFDKKKFDYNKFQRLLIDRFKTNFEGKQANKRSRMGDKDYWDLIDATKTASKLLITTLEPAELHKSELANRLKNELLEKAEIIPTNQSIGRGSYKFFFPNSTGGYVAREFWEKLREYAVEKKNIPYEEVNKRLQEANLDGRIITYLVDKEIAFMPFVFLDYDTKRILGFCVSYHSEELSVARLSNKVVYSWKQTIYNKLVAIEEQAKEEDGIEFKFKEIM